MTTKKLTLLAMLFAMALVLSYVENSIPPITGLIPGIKLGLSNIVVMYGVFCIDSGSAIYIALMKSGFVLITRGITSATLSLCGGLGSVLIMIILLIIFKEKISYTAISICASITHNLVQLVIAMFITGTKMTAVYLPVLIASGIF
ncbi:MAG: Gx transporter family protein, partial [Lachnospiraceae bacterium]|nr:Gx transporter family protein [Lachnospiraceae bacterium]